MLREQQKTIEVLDKGYVRIIDVLGSDLAVVNAARASYAKESAEFEDRDDKLLSFLIREHHWSPFRHAMMTFEFKAPLMVARQHWKYVVGSDHTMDGWNEASRRYITMATEFYVPKMNEWRSAPENSKQGSGDPLSPDMGSILMHKLIMQLSEAQDNYEQAIEAGVAPEQARLFLPMYGMYTNYRWTCSLQSVCHFLQERLAHDAQLEIQLYAQAVRELVGPYFPRTMEKIVDSI